MTSARTIDRRRATGRARTAAGRLRPRLAWLLLSALAPFMASPALADITKSDIVVRLEPVAAGLVSPIHLTHAGDGSDRLFIVDQTGRILLIKNGRLMPAPFLDLSGVIVPLAAGFDERGLLGLAFHPDYARNGRFFVRYSGARPGAPGEPCFGTSRGCHEEILAEFAVSSDPDVADPTGTILFRVDEPQFNHDGGTVAFGPDGLLYFSLGDGGGANDGLADVPPSHGPIGNGQNIDTVLGAILRIDVDHGAPYAIPPDNPFVGGPGADEIYAYGMRNPYSFAFDGGPGGDGSLIVADVGQLLFEEIDVVVKGGNYGWVIREGFACFDPFNPTLPPASCSRTGPRGEPLLDPIADYSHAEGGISVIGGHVYRGTRSRRLAGKYVFGDFSASFGVPGGRLYFLPSLAPAPVGIQEFRIDPGDRPYGRFLKGFGEGRDGEIYALGSGRLGPVGDAGVIERIVALPAPALDIKPGACPNAVNSQALGVLPIALMGDADFDVAEVDVSTLALTRADPIQVFTAALDGSQENPPTGSTATGEAFMTLNLDTNELTMDLSFQGLIGTQTVQHVHGPAAPEQNASVLFGIPGPGSFRGFSVVLTQDQKRIIRAGLAYVNVHSTRNPGGEIRGRILPVAVRPLRASIEDAGSPFAGDLCGCHEGAPDGRADVVLKFDNREVLSALGLDRPSGAGQIALTLGGHLQSDRGAGRHLFRFALEGLQEVPANNSTGAGECTVLLDESSASVSVSCTYDGLAANPTASHIHAPAQPGTNAPVVVPLTVTGGTSGVITGGGTLTPALVRAVLDGLAYVNLHTDVHLGGELRGQISGGETFSASDCLAGIRRFPLPRTVIRPE